MDTSLPALMQRARAADAHARDRLLEAYRNYLRVTAQVWLPDNVAAKCDPSDLVQETLLKAHQRFEQFRGTTEAELIFWLRRILSHCLIDMLRHYRGEGRNVLRETVVSPFARNSVDVFGNLALRTETSPSGQAANREMSVLLADELSRMPEHYRQVIVLRSIREKPWKDVAAAMSREIGTVRALWVRALTHLRERMEQYLEP